MRTELIRASALIGAGTVASRLTGLVRTILLVMAVGATTSAGNAFAIANQLPNNVYALISAGLLSAVVVPQIVKSAAHHDGGSIFASRLFTLATVALLGTTSLAVLAAPWVVSAYAPGFSPSQQALTTAFAYWCLPQILFYGLYSLVGETLNARRVYGPFTWAPVVNNLVSIAGLLTFIAVFGQRGVATDWTPGMIALLAGTATVGIATQAGILFAFWRKTGLHIRPDFRWKGVGLGQIGKLAGWVFLMVLGSQVAGLIQTRILSEAARDHPGVMVAGNSWLLFMLPYSIIVLSIGTPYFTELSEHAVARNTSAVRTDITNSIRATGVLIVPATAALAAAAVPASRVFTDSSADAAAAAAVLLSYLTSLVPLAVLFVIQRVFYAYDDTRSPFIFSTVQCSLVVVTAWCAKLMLEADIIDLANLTATVALGQSISSIVQVMIAVWLLRRRLGGLQVGSWLLPLCRYAILAFPAGICGWAVFQLMGGSEGWTTETKMLGVLGAAVIGAIVFVSYIGFLALFRAPELSTVVTMARRALSRGRQGS